MDATTIYDAPVIGEYRGYELRRGADIDGKPSWVLNDAISGDHVVWMGEEGLKRIAADNLDERFSAG